MAPTTAGIATDSSTPPLFWWVFGSLVCMALIPTIWPELDLVAAAPYFGSPPAVESLEWWWVRWINDWVPAAFRVLILLCLAAWWVLKLQKRAVSWRMALLYVAIAGTLGPGIVVNLGFKDHWQRARPYQVQNFGGEKQFTRAAVITDQCNDNCSFVSGHVACGYFFVSLMLLQRRRAVTWAALGLGSAALIAFARMSDKAHWLSDTLWAGPITLLTCWLVWRMMVRIYGPALSAPAA
jgi:lipid A 4'-phosphatase